MSQQILRIIDGSCRRLYDEETFRYIRETSSRQQMQHGLTSFGPYLRHDMTEREMHRCLRIPAPVVLPGLSVGRMRAPARVGEIEREGGAEGGGQTDY